MSKPSGRFAETISVEVADILRSLKDPRLTAMVSVLRTDVNRDRSLARVHLSLYGPPEAVQETFAVLERAKGHVRSELAKRLNVRHTPELQFVADDSIAFSDHLERLLRQQGEEHGRE
jgi:ribosome-binding factor A